MAKNINKKTFLEWFSSPFLCHLLIDTNGTVVDCSDNIGTIAQALSRPASIGHPFGSFLAPFDVFASQFLDIATIKRFPMCPPNIFVKANEGPNTFGSGSGIFLLTYSYWQEIDGEPLLIVSLLPQPFNAPLVINNMARFRCFQVPVVFLENGEHIISYNPHFLNIVKNIDRKDLYDRSLLELLKGDKKPNPFLFTERIQYINYIGRQAGKPWSHCFDLFAKKTLHEVFPRHFDTAKSITKKFQANGITLGRRNNDSLPYIAYKHPVNYPDKDIRIGLEASMTEGSDITLSLGHGLCPNDKDFPQGYHVDIKLFNILLLELFRNSTSLLSCEVPDIMAGEVYTLEIARTGALLTVSVNNKTVIRYADPFPLVNINISHFYMYIWKQSMTLTRFKLFDRPSLFDHEILEAQGISQIFFKANPEKAYAFRADPVGHIGKHAIAVQFREKIAGALRTEVQNPVSLFENAKQYINDNFNRHIDFKMLAKTCCVSYPHFCKVFKKYFELSPGKYQIRLRLNEAIILLKSGRYKVREAGLMAGFEDEVNFQHVFRNHYGMSPGEYVVRGSLNSLIS